jgi:hypothetical protein
MRKIAGVMIPAGVALIGAGLMYAQYGRGGGDWTTSGYDAQRSFWVRSDPKISLESLEKPGFQMIWKVNLSDRQVAANPLTDAVVLNFYIGYRGFRSFGFLGGLSNSVYAVDTDLSRIEWRMHLPGAESSPCAAVFVTQVARPTSLEIAGAVAGGGRGRSAFARGAVGQPNQGAPNLEEASMRRPMAPPNAGRGGRNGGRNAGRRALPNAFSRGPSYVYALTSDGMLHLMLVSNGQQPEPALKFLPPNANPSGLIVADDVAYAVNTKGCGSAPEGIWALDLESKKVASWKGSVAGSAGIAFDPEDTLYVATGSGSGAHADSVVALDAKTLEPKNWYAAGSAFTSSPVVFEYKDQLLAAAATRDGRLHLLDTKSLGGADHKTPLSITDASLKAPGTALASWEDSNHTRWILAPAGNTIVAWKVVDRNGAPALESGWTSPEMTSPLPPMIVNGVIFAVAGGNPSSPAVLYALDPGTGKEIWNSGNSISSYIPSGGLSAGGSQLYLGAADGTLYAFGFPMEH